MKNSVKCSSFASRDNIFRCSSLGELLRKPSPRLAPDGAARTHRARGRRLGAEHRPHYLPVGVEGKGKRPYPRRRPRDPRRSPRFENPEFPEHARLLRGVPRVYQVESGGQRERATPLLLRHLPVRALAGRQSGRLWQPILLSLRYCPAGVRRQGRRWGGDVRHGMGSSLGPAGGARAGVRGHERVPGNAPLPSRRRARRRRRR